MRYSIAIALLLSFFSLSGCSLIRPFEEPEVQVVNLSFENATLFETAAVVELRIDNENPFPLEVEGGVHRLYINDVYVGKGIDNQGFSVAQLSSIKHPITIYISNVSILTKLQSLFSESTLTYRIESKLHTAGSYRSINISDKGEVNFSTIASNTSGRQLLQYQRTRLKPSAF